MKIQYKYQILENIEIHREPFSRSRTTTLEAKIGEWEWTRPKI